MDAINKHKTSHQIGDNDRAATQKKLSNVPSPLNGTILRVQKVRAERKKKPSRDEVSKPRKARMSTSEQRHRRDGSEQTYKQASREQRHPSQNERSKQSEGILARAN